MSGDLTQCTEYTVITREGQNHNSRNVGPIHFPMGMAGYKVEFHMGDRGGLMKNWEKKNGGE